MAKRIQLPNEFYEGYKLYRGGKTSGQIKDALKESSHFVGVSVRTVHGWSVEYRRIQNDEIDDPWLWENFEKYSAYGIASHLLSLPEVVSHRQVYTKYVGSAPSIREVKYIYLLGGFRQAWGEEDVTCLAQQFAMTEFMVNCGKLGEADIQKLRDEIDDKLNRSNQ